MDDRIGEIMGSLLGGGMDPPRDGLDLPDTQEEIKISSLAILKMLKHGRAGVPMEVMGLMLGSFVDKYTITVNDVFAMPQSGTGVSVEAVDPVYQTKMMDQLKMTGRSETVVGWYHSHPGFGCWLSSVDVNTQKSFETLAPRSVAVVIDPVQSVKGKVVIDAFRCINDRVALLNKFEPREVTSLLGHQKIPSVVQLIHGLDRAYYALNIGYRRTQMEETVLLSLSHKSWFTGLVLPNLASNSKKTEQLLEQMLQLSKQYPKYIDEESKVDPNELRIKRIGLKDPKRHLEETVDQLMADNISLLLGTYINSAAFK